MLDIMYSRHYIVFSMLYINKDKLQLEKDQYHEQSTENSTFQFDCDIDRFGP